MPVIQGRDASGSYYRWGTQTKYYYTPGNKQSRKAARSKAIKQGQAIQISKARRFKK